MSLWQHIRHSRGYGIHSPFAYRLVREVMMKRRVEGERHDLCDALCDMGVGRRSAVRLQNYFTYYGCSWWAIDFADEINEGALLIFTPRAAASAVETIGRIGGTHATVCILRPTECRAESTAAIERHTGMSVGNHELLMLFYNEPRPKQHITI